MDAKIRIETICKGDHANHYVCIDFGDGEMKVTLHFLSIKKQKAKIVSKIVQVRGRFLVDGPDSFAIVMKYQEEKVQLVHFIGDGWIERKDTDPRLAAEWDVFSYGKQYEGSEDELKEQILEFVTDYRSIPSLVNAKRGFWT